MGLTGERMGIFLVVTNEEMEVGMNTRDWNDPWKPEKHILIVEDDMIQRENLVSLLREYSAGGGFAVATVHEAANGEDALKIAESTEVDLAILDVVLAGGGMDGHEACAKLREMNFRGRIILLSGERNTGDDKADGIDLGADDYMSKPFSSREMKARIESQLRAGESSSDPQLRFGPFSLFTGRREIVLGDGRKELLTDKEAGILHMLYLARGRVVGRQELLERVWGYNSRVNTHTLETHIYRVRQKIEPFPASPQYVVSDEGGYRLASHPPAIAA